MPGDAMDFGALAARLAVNIDDVRACVLMSRDGFTLGVYPREQEASTREVWDRLMSIGHPERGFLVVGDELWIVARRGPYAGIVIASVSATPGLLLDRLEFTLRAAEELRMHEGSTPVGPRTEAARRPRSPLHPEPTSRADEKPDWLAAAAPEAEAVEELAASPMLDLSSADSSADSVDEPQADQPPPPVASTAEAPVPDNDEPLDPVRAAMEFASMTGAVGAIPTLPRPAEPPAPPPPTDTEPEDETPAEGEAEGPSDDVVPEPPLEPLESPDPPDPPQALESLESLDLPLEDLPALTKKQKKQRKEPDPPEGHEDPGGSENGKAEDGTRDGEEEAEVDPVALAREFAQLFTERDEEAR